MSKQFAAALNVLEMLEQSGFEAFLVGGCVRDRLLGKEPADYDITTNALPNEVQQLFPRTIPTGIHHGTVTVIQDEITLEVTTYRTEGLYQDHRRPSEVRFVSNLKEDLLRRDFTINALAMDRNGQIVDYVDGQKDLERKIIRTVGSAEERFQEDALRMLRAARFTAQFSFRIDPLTLAAISRCGHFASHLAVERVTTEFIKIWRTDKPSTGLKPMIATGLLESLSPFIHNPVFLEINTAEWEKLDSLDAESIKWAYFFYLVFRRNMHDKQVCNENLISTIPKFKFSNQQKKSIIDILEIASNWNPEMTMEEGKSLLLSHQLDAMMMGETLWQYVSGSKEYVSLEEWWKEMPIHHFSQLAIKGDNVLKATGLPAGPWLKETLNYLFHQVAYGYIPNKLEDLMMESKLYVNTLIS